MDIFIKHQLDKDASGYILTLYINPDLTEFAKELTNKEDISTNKNFYYSIKNYISENFKNIKINTIKLMAGSMLIASIPFTSPVSVSAAATGVQSSQSSSPISIIINGQKYQFSRSPVIKNGTTYIPLRDVAETLGAEVWWNASSKTVGINKDNTKISFVVGSNKVRVNDRLIEMQPAYIDNRTTMVPLRFISESLGMDVHWDQNTKTINIRSSLKSHKVKAGESLWKIANQYNTTVSKIKELNALKGDTIYAGQELKIETETNAKINTPSSSNYITYMSYSLKAGDNLWDLSIKYGVPFTELLAVNNMTENSPLSVGQKIKIPVHHIAQKERVSERHGEYLDWWTEAQYLFPIDKVATVTDFQTGKSFKVKRTTGAFHADCEPLSAKDAAIIKEIWGGNYSWKERAVIVQVDGRKIAASMASMPHDVAYITDNNFNGHFDIHFKNSIRHKDGLISTAHQEQVKIAAGIR